MKDVLKGRQVILTESRDGDADYFEAHQWAKGFARSSEWDVAQVRQHESFIKMFSEAPTDSFIFVIRKQSDNKPIGWIEIDGIQIKNQVCELGIGILDPGERNQGYGTDALNCMLAYAFFELGMFKVRLGVNANNEIAVHAYEGVGFKREVVDREALYQDGHWFDKYEYAIFGQDWMANHQDWTEF